MDTIAPFAMTACGIEELGDHSGPGASHVLSILDSGYPVPAAFGRFGVHKKLELRFHDVIEEGPDMGDPAAGGCGAPVGLWA